MDAPILRVEDLVKSFGSRRAVDGLSFAVAPKEIFGLLGPNGAGKSTTIGMLVTLARPDGGRIEIAGIDVVREPERVRPLIGYVPQELALYPALSARDNLAFFGRIYGLGGRKLAERVEAVLEVVGLRERGGDLVRTFSGGMMRRLNLAAGLVHGPKLLFLDEPTVGVDPQSRNSILEHVLRLRDEGLTILYTSHYMEEVQRLCDRVAIVDEGRLLALDSPKALIAELGEGLLVIGLPEGGAEALTACATTVNALGKVTARDGLLYVEARNVNKALLELLDLCSVRELGLGSLQVLEPSLESVFLRLTGKRLRD
ncbi:MAG: ABC transporter ATP-binding protein [Deltaproteobacteria bacterium]|nr:ABC transporter ATP-binding protein [Deltaproteobacteria bacterium]